MENIKLSPENWEQALSILLIGYVDANKEGKKLAHRELKTMAQIADVAQPAIEGLQALINDPTLMSIGRILDEMSEAAKERLKPELKDKLKVYQGVNRALASARVLSEKNK